MSNEIITPATSKNLILPKPHILSVAGAQYGDEGKGKIVDTLASDYEIVMRYQGGANAGHTVYHNDEEFVFHLIPSGFFNEDVEDVILEQGMVVDPYKLYQEYEDLKEAGFDEDYIKNKINIAERINITLPEYYFEELGGIATDEIKSTARGIGPTYTHKHIRDGLQLVDALKNSSKLVERGSEAGERLENGLDKLCGVYDNLRRAWHMDKDEKEFKEEYEEKFIMGLEIMEDMMVDNLAFYGDAREEGKNILVEGAQGTLLSKNFGSYPFVTSSDPTVNGISTNTAVRPQDIDYTIGVFKIGMTRVGGGPFYTKISDNQLETDEISSQELEGKLREAGGEYGATTGRPRDVGWLDLVALDHAQRVNDFNELAMIKADVLGGVEEIRYGVAYEDEKGNIINRFPSSSGEDLKPVLETFEGGSWPDVDWKSIKSADKLPDRLKNFANMVEENLYGDARINFISIGPKRDQMVRKSREDSWVEI